MIQYKVTKPLWDGVTWHEVGADFPPTHRGETVEIPHKTMEKYIKGGFIDTVENIKKQTNPQAAAAEATVEALSADLNSIRGLFPETGGVGDVISAIQALQANQGSGAADAVKAEKAETERWQKLANENGAQITNLTKERDELKSALEDAQAKAARPEDADALAEYREVVGALIPREKVPTRIRNILFANGYYTEETVAQTEDADLAGLDGLGKDSVAELRKAIPYTPSQE